MLIQFQVKNFGPIKDTQTLSMEASSDTDLEDYYVCKINKLRILKLAVIYGPNASGKTTILKALDFLRGLVTKARLEKSDTLNFVPFWFDENSRNEPSQMLIIFVQDTIKYEYEIIFNQDCIIEEKLFYYPKSRKSAFFLRKTDIVNKLSYITWGETAKLTKKNADIIEGNTIWNEPVLAALNKSNMTVDMLSNVQNWFKQYLQMMIAPNVNVMNWASNMVEHLPQYKSMMTAFLKKADIQIDAIEIVKEKPPFDLREATMELVQEIDLPSTTDNMAKTTTTKRTKIPMDQVNIIEQKTLFFHHPIKNKDGSTSSYPLHWELESFGTRHNFGLTSLLTMLMTSKHLCSIDEIDTSLHPDLMKHFILTFLTNAKQSQLIVTTHNISFLENQDILRKDVIKFTEKKEDGSTELYALSDFDPAIFRKNPSFLTAYKIGKLGAKPNLGDYYLEVENEQK